jgi:hypothetical protein
MRNEHFHPWQAVQIAAEGMFGPPVEKLIAQLPAISARFGEKSPQYATLSVQIGDAHMVQGLLSNPQAQRSYEAALEILQTMEDVRPEIAWVHDKLACVKQSSGDSFGAQADLEKAVSFWRENPPANRLGPVALQDHVARREEDLERLVKLNAFLNRKPPEL